MPFELVFLVMDPGYNAINRQRIESNAALLHIPITVFETNIFEVANSTDKSPCYLCARMRRGHLYSKAKELGCNKIALGHHFSDVIETTVMGLFYGGQLQAMEDDEVVHGQEGNPVHGVGRSHQAHGDGDHQRVADIVARGEERGDIDDDEDELGPGVQPVDDGIAREELAECDVFEHQSAASFPSRARTARRSCSAV